ncbi:hypothetical protein D4S03_04340 [bacterium]|nr:MAG: hypothetical protein D4S03_04340 [bacterium]
MARRIKTYGDCLRTLNWIYNQKEKKLMTDAEATCQRANVLAILKVIEASDMEWLKEKMQNRKTANKADWYEDDKDV